MLVSFVKFVFWCMTNTKRNLKDLIVYLLNFDLKKTFLFQSQETNWYFLLKHHFFSISACVNSVNENAIVNNTKKSIDIEFESRIMLGSY
jgi:hypothetical protein